MSHHRKRQRQIERRLGNRALIYWGVRGADARPLLAFEQLERVFSLISPLGADPVRGEASTCLELLGRRRVDLDHYCAATDISTARQVDVLRTGLLEAFQRPVAVLPYRACPVLSSAWFPRADQVLYLGMFHEQQACFEHKPWVETQVRSKLKLPLVDWHYVAEADARLPPGMRDGPVVVRTSRSQGGGGFALVEQTRALHRVRSGPAERFVAVSRFLEQAVPVNVNACVFPDGTTTLHAASLQLIGLPACTRRPFGYCGNDFGAIRDQLGRKQLDALDTMVRRVGRWLAANGYVGAFGLDALVHEGRVLFSELNPRFQASSPLAARIDQALDRPDVYLDHMAAFLDLPAGGDRPLRELVRAQPDLAHIVFHNTSDRAMRLAALTPGATEECRLLPSRTDIRMDPDAVTFGVVVARSVTADGRSLLPWAAKQVDRLLAHHHGDKWNAAGQTPDRRAAAFPGGC